MQTSVVVHKIIADGRFYRAGQHALFLSPTMKLMEQPSSYLADLAKRSRSSATNRNNAYALSYWFNFCRAADVDWQHAAIDDIFDYKSVLETEASEQTGANRSEGTVSQYIFAVVDFYDHAFCKCWYSGDIRKSELSVHAVTPDGSVTPSRPGRSALGKKAFPVRRISNRSGTMIRPLSVDGLRRFLSAVGPDASDAPDGLSTRNRLIADWGWAVGLRISELVSLKAAQFTNLEVDPSAPWIHFSIEVRGKGNKLRQVSVPSWLIEHTLAYILGERERCLASSTSKSREEKLFVSSTTSSSPGNSITPRRIESIFANAYIRAGLWRNAKRIDNQSGAISWQRVPAHCVHDLRHTYAVLTYHAEVAQGNCEPWKKIQAQLGHSSMKTTTDIYLEYVHGHNEYRHASVRDLIGLTR